jgi:hypothetical protein
MRTTKALPGTATMIAASVMLVGCERDPVRVESVDATRLTPAAGSASAQMAASGTFTQTAITSIDVSVAGKNTIIDQTAVGAITGTLTGQFEDDLKVVIHPNGKFNASFTIRCVCTVDGRLGVVEMVAEDAGELLSPTLAAFSGRAVIKGATGALSGLRGVLQIEGTVNVTTSLATYGYTGDVHFEP